MRLTLALVGWSVCSLVAAQAFAAVHLQTTDGKNLSWPVGKKIVLHVDPTHAPVESAAFVQLLNNAFSVWVNASKEAPSASAGIDPNPTEDSSKPTHRVQVLDQTNWPYDDATLAVTTYTYSRKSGELVDADILVNGAGPCFATGDTLPNHCYDLLSVLTHEAGHFLGLDHATDDKEAVMYPTLGAGDISKRVLSRDDISGITASYGVAPETATPSTSLAGRATIASQTTAAAEPFLVPAQALPAAGCSQSDASSLSLWALALLAPMVVRRRALKTAMAAVVLVTAMASTQASATSRVAAAMKPSDTDSLVVGRASKGHSYVDPALGLVVTEYTVDTVACLGAKCEPQGRFVMLGGEVNGLVTRVAGETAHDDSATFIFYTGKAGLWKRVHEASLPLNLLHTLEAQGLLSRATRLGR